MNRIKQLIVALALLAVPVMVLAGNIEIKQSGPSGQGNLIFWCPVTGVTNLVLGTGGVYRITLDPSGSGVTATATKATQSVHAPTTNAPVVTVTLVTATNVLYHYDAATNYTGCSTQVVVTGVSATATLTDQTLTYVTNVTVAVTGP